MATNIQATTPKERLSVLDSLRGFALFGVLVVNGAMINSTLANYSANTLNNPFSISDPLERIITLMIQLLGVGKFYTLFSFMFGLGFYLFYSRLSNREMDAKKLFKRRLLILLFFGLLHLTFVWHGDILHAYALVGFFMVPFHKASEKKIKGWAIGLLVFYLILITGLLALVSLAPPDSPSVMAANEASRAFADQVYNQSNYMETTVYRLSHEVPILLANFLFILPKLLGMFLLGLYAGKREWFVLSPESQVRFRKILKVAFPLGLITTLGYTWLLSGDLMAQFPYGHPGVTFLQESSYIFLSLSYMSILALTYWAGKAKVLYNALASVGRMALTNYLTQCIILSFVFYGYGFGWMYRVGNATTLMLALVIFGAQMVFSHFYFKSFTYGPAEYLWRWLTYRGVRA